MGSVSTDGVTPSGNSAQLRGSWANLFPDSNHWMRYGLSGDLSNETAHQPLGDVSGSWSDTIGTDFDRTYNFQAKSEGVAGGVLFFLSFAQAPTTGTPAASAVTNNSATISCTFNANVVESTFSVQMQYRKFGDVNWINAGSPVTSGGTASANLTGLLGSTTYEFRLSGTRTTANAPNITSSTQTFTTNPDAPTINTNAATVVTSSGAQLNGSVNANGLSVRVRFGWGTSDGGATPGSWANLTVYQNFSGSTLQSFQQAISGLSATTSYFFRAFVEWPSPGFANGASGSSLTFTTPADPLVEAAKEEQMDVLQYDGHYGVATDIYFSLNAPAATSSDRLVTTAVGTLFAAGDVQVSKDGGALANAANAVSQVGSGALYKLTLSAAEMQAELVMVQIIDLDGPLFRDKWILVRTKERLGQVIVRADQIGSSASAVSYRPSTGGYSLDCQDSAGSSIGLVRGFLESMSERVGTLQAGGASTATLDASASATNDYYTEDILMIVGGTGAGQARVITAYNGTTKVATLNGGWSTNPDSTSRYVILPGMRTLSLTVPELTGIPSATDTAGKKLQFIFQRFAFKVTQTAVLQTLYNSSGTSIGTRSVSDDGTTQTIQKVA